MPGTGFLTEKQRRFLADQRPEMSASNKRATKTRIKKRTISAVRDFQFLLNLSDNKLQEIADELGRGSLSDERRVIDERIGTETEQRRTAGELVPLIQFCYIGVGRKADILENMIENAIIWSDLDPIDHDMFVTNVKIETEPTTQAIKEKFERGEELTDRELALLVRNGHAVGLDYQELESEMVQEDG